MPKASDLKRGMIIDMDGVPHIIKQLEAKSPSSRGATTLYKVRFNNLQTHQKLDIHVSGAPYITNLQGPGGTVPISKSLQ